MPHEVFPLGIFFFPVCLTEHPELTGEIVHQICLGKTSGCSQEELDWLRFFQTRFFDVADRKGGDGHYCCFQVPFTSAIWGKSLFPDWTELTTRTRLHPPLVNKSLRFLINQLQFKLLFFCQIPPGSVNCIYVSTLRLQPTVGSDQGLRSKTQVPEASVIWERLKVEPLSHN